MSRKSELTIMISFLIIIFLSPPAADGKAECEDYSLKKKVPMNTQIQLQNISVNQLKQAFNKLKGKTRIVAIVSPT